MQTVSNAMAPAAERAFGNEVAHGFPKERASDVEVANGFITSKVTAGDFVEVAENGYTTKESTGNVEIAENGFTAKEKVVNVKIAENGFTSSKEEADDVEVANDFTKKRTGDDAEVLHDFSPLLVVYKSGRLERPLIVPVVPAGRDDATGVVSKDVPLSPFSFVRLYLPPGIVPGGGEEKEKREVEATNAKLPVVVYFHGGGFVMGSAASCVYHRFVNDLAAACPAVAVSVDYRLAPEHLLPAAYEDSLAALKWVLSAADPWLAAHADLRRVFLAGDSAGGNICHHLAMHPDTRAVGGGVRGVVLIHPWFWGKQPIAGELEHRRGGGRERKLSLWELVCPDAADGVDDPRMNPTAAGAPGLENLACGKVMVCVAEGDHLRWRGKAYAEAAARAAVVGAVETVESEGVGHVFYLLDPDMDEARDLLGRIAAFVRDDDTSEKGASERGAARA